MRGVHHLQTMQGDAFDIGSSHLRCRVARYSRRPRPQHKAGGISAAMYFLHAQPQALGVLVVYKLLQELEQQ